MLHYIVYCCNPLESVTVIFPIRAHSYMECDRNMAYLNQKTRIELTEEWAKHVRGARPRPNPFNVIKSNCPFSIRPVCINEEEFKLPGLAYRDKLPISTAKYNDLQFLKKFCRPETKRYYDQLPHAANIKDATAD
ncbi:hypothetical protein WA026_020365 [Henosepilachna vigintioctopunctata]|uniref:Uncharacterized protein n=1 Tax=Henosepilachna vigintioctopunctata TaxID=420089 RepID=A0AAW1UGT6_9CUCU